MKYLILCFLLVGCITDPEVVVEHKTVTIMDTETDTLRTVIIDTQIRIDTFLVIDSGIVTKAFNDSVAIALKIDSVAHYKTLYNIKLQELRDSIEIERQMAEIRAIIGNRDTVYITKGE